MKEKTQKNWQAFILFLFAILIISSLAACFYIYSRIERNAKILDKLVMHDIAQQKDLTKIAAWQKNIIEQYIDTANLVLSDNKDTKTAILLLDAAKKYTDSSLNNKIIIDLDKNINTLKAINLVNIEELVARIDIIGQNINNLTIIPNTAIPNTAPVVTAHPTSSSSEIQGEQKHLDSTTTPKESKKPFSVNFSVERQALYGYSRHIFEQILKGLKDIVIVRHNALEPIVSLEQEATLRFNLNAKIMQMELAVMQKHDAIYHSCLTQITNLIRKYFICSSSEKDRILGELDELQKINLQPQLPKISISI